MQIDNSLTIWLHRHDFPRMPDENCNFNNHVEVMVEVCTALYNVGFLRDMDAHAGWLWICGNPQNKDQLVAVVTIRPVGRKLSVRQTDFLRQKVLVTLARCLVNYDD